MLKALFSRAQGFNLKASPADLLIFSFPTQRLFSTNSAIRRGIRKSRPQGYNSESRSQYDGNRSTRFSGEHGTPFTERRDAPSRERRPNHQEGLDVDDMRVRREPKNVNLRSRQRPTLLGNSRQRDDSSQSYRRTYKESDNHRDMRDSFQDQSRGSSWDRRSLPKTSFGYKEDASQGRPRASERYESRGSLASLPTRQSFGRKSSQRDDQPQPFRQTYAESDRYDRGDSFKSPARGSSRDERNLSKEPPEYKENAFEGRFRAPGRYEARNSPASAPTRRRNETFGEERRTPGRYDSRVSLSLAPTKGREEMLNDEWQPRGQHESRGSPSSTRDLRRPPNRAERRSALYGAGDTAPGGIPRSEVPGDWDGSALRRASKQLRRAATIRNSGELSEPGLRDESEVVSDKPYRRAETGESDFSRRDYEDTWRVKTNVPLSIPYTTSASEFLYGTSVIFAALTAMRRKMYKLYVYGGENREAGAKEDSIQDLARDRKVEVIKVDGDWLRVMDKLSTGRPHNGYILEASPLPKLPVTGLESVSNHTQGSFNVCLDHQSAEEESVNGTGNLVKYEPVFSRYPLILLLDGILDPGNLGAVLRTAFFLGVDAVAISSGHSAPLTPVALKASAGACEALPLLSVSNPFKFIDDARNKGWKTYAAVAPGEPNTISSRSAEKHPNAPVPPVDTRTYSTITTLGRPTRDHPCILMLGSEGDGLRKPLLKKSDVMLSIEGRRGGLSGIVDSLNVSVAAGLLCDAFLRPSPNSEKKRKGVPQSNIASNDEKEENQPDSAEREGGLMKKFSVW